MTLIGKVAFAQNHMSVTNKDSIKHNQKIRAAWAVAATPLKDPSPTAGMGAYLSAAARE